jgi:ATP-binding cassette subfamily C (CFTR/MRP) protein 4
VSALTHRIFFEVEMKAIRLAYDLVTWSWMTPTVVLGTKQPLQPEDLLQLPTQDHSHAILQRYDALVASQYKADAVEDEDRIRLPTGVDGASNEPKIAIPMTSGDKEKTNFPYMGTAKILWKMFAKEMAIYGIAEVIYSTFTVIQPIILRELISFLQTASPDESNSKGYLYAGLLSGLAFFLPLLHHCYYFGAYRVGAKMRVLLNTLIFRKLMKLSIAGVIDKITTGQIVNLVSNDSYKMETGIMYHMFLIVAPLQGAAVNALLIFQLGVAPALAGAAMMILMIPLQLSFSRRFAAFRRETLPFTDERVKTIKEALMGVEIMKLYNWEKPIFSKIEKARHSEMKGIKKSAFLQAINQSIFFVSVSLATFVTLGTYTLMGETLTTAIIFYTLSLFNAIQVPVMLLIPYSIQNLSESMVACFRIDRFMGLAEVSSTKSVTESEETQILEGTFTWTSEEDPVLSDINLKIPPKSLTLIFGSIGASKSSLFAALLHEIKKVKGVVRVPKEVSYAAQKPWIFTGTVRENILFAREFDEHRYAQVLDVCELVHDIDSFHAGDMTIIGERGVNLSGGQKARISLARCLYNDADLYLLDDPLAAVDPIVGKRILERCLGPESFLRNKTRILVTHHTQFRSYADYLIQLDKGQVVYQGTPQGFAPDEVEDKSMEIVEEPVVPSPKVIAELVSKRNVNMKDAKADPFSIIDREDRSTGSISAKVYSSLFNFGGGSLVFFVTVFALTLAQVSLFAIYFWLNHWAEESKADQENNLNLNVSVFAGLVVWTLLVAVSAAFLYFNFMIKAATNLHDSMISSVVGAPIRFFEANPLGRILNRFSRDQSAVDEQLPMTSFDFVRCVATCVGALILVLIANPWILISLVLLLPLFYLKAIRQLL